MPKDTFTDSKKSDKNFEILKPRQIGGVEQVSSRCQAHGLNNFLKPRHMLIVEKVVEF